MATKAITDKTFVLSLKSGEKIYITEKQSQEFNQAILEEKDFIPFKFDTGKIGTIGKYEIRFVLPAEEVEKGERYKKGDWHCKKHNNWVARNVQCGYC